VIKITLDASTIRNAFAGQADALRQVQGAGNNARTALTEDPGEIVVTRTHALGVLRALAADPQTARTAFTWATLVRTGMDAPGMGPLDVEIDPEAEVPVLEAVHALDYLDDGPLPAHYVQQLISALEGPHSAGPPALTL